MTRGGPLNPANNERRFNVTFPWPIPTDKFATLDWQSRGREGSDAR